MTTIYRCIFHNKLKGHDLRIIVASSNDLQRSQYSIVLQKASQESYSLQTIKNYEVPIHKFVLKVYT